MLLIETYLGALLCIFCTGRCRAFSRIQHTSSQRSLRHPWRLAPGITVQVSRVRCACVGILEVVSSCTTVREFGDPAAPKLSAIENGQHSDYFGGNAFCSFFIWSAWSDNVIPCCTYYSQTLEQSCLSLAMPYTFAA